MPNSTDIKVNSFIINKTTEELLKTQTIEPNQIYITPDDSTSGGAGGSNLNLENSELISKNIEGQPIDTWQLTNKQAFLALLAQDTESSGSQLLLNPSTIIMGASDSGTKNTSFGLSDTYIDLDVYDGDKHQSIEISADAVKLNNKKILVEGDVVDLTSQQTIIGEKKFTSPLWIEVPQDSYNNIIIKSSGTDNRPTVNIGNNTNRSWGSILLGYNNIVSTYNSIAIGQNNSISTNGYSNFLIGAYQAISDSSHYNFVFSWNNGQNMIYGNNNILIGKEAKTRLANGSTSNVNDAIQLGTGVNPNSKTFQVFEYQILNGNTGKIPIERLPDEISKTYELATEEDINNIIGE